MVEKENFRFNQLYYLGTENFKQKDIKQIISVPTHRYCADDTTGNQ